jgi:hypothetical protein
MSRRMYSSAPPEIFMFMGINVFLVMSFSISIFEEEFPKPLPYVFQIAALAGFGQIWANYILLSASIDSRFWSSLFYLAMAIISVIAINLYVGIRKKRLSSAGILLGVFTIPVSAISFFLVSAYTNGITIPMPALPIVPIADLSIVLVSSMVILGLSILLYLKPDKLKKIFDARRKQCKSSGITFETRLEDDDQEITNQEEVISDE